MKVYLINKQTKEIVREFKNVISWDYNSVTFMNGGYVGKIYADENEYFTDTYEEHNEETN